MKLFKYVCPQRIDILENRMICFSTPQQLNDPFELNPHIEGVVTQETCNSSIKDEVAKLRGEYSRLPRNSRRKMTFDDFARQVSDFAHKELTSEVKLGMAKKAKVIIDKELVGKIGILSLTERPDNLLMWAHYADSHQGFVIEFDPESSFFNQRRSSFDEFGYLREVKYSEARPSLILEEVEDISPYLTKGNVWKSECEWRMMLPIHMRNKQLPCGHNLFSFPPLAIKRIILGCRTTDVTKKIVKEVIKNNPDFMHVKLMNASIDQEHFRVNID